MAHGILQLLACLQCEHTSAPPTKYHCTWLVHCFHQINKSLISPPVIWSKPSRNYQCIEFLRNLRILGKAINEKYLSFYTVNAHVRLTRITFLWQVLFALLRTYGARDHAFLPKAQQRIPHLIIVAFIIQVKTTQYPLLTPQGLHSYTQPEFLSSCSLSCSNLLETKLF